MQKLILDFDSVIVNSIKSYVDVYNRYYSIHKDFKVADYTKVHLWSFGDTCPLAKNNVDDIFSKKDFFELLEFMPQAKETIEKLSHKYDITICSIGSAQNIAHKVLWIEKNLPFINNLIMLSNKGIKMNKSVIDMKGDIFIDDHIDNLNSSNADRRICFGKRFTWNEDWQGEYCKDWLEVEKLLLNQTHKYIK